MKMKSTVKSVMCVIALGAAAAMILPVTADARVGFSIGVGLPVYGVAPAYPAYAYPVAYPYPYPYYVPAPYAPPPAAYASPPPAYVPPGYYGPAYAR